jgi:serine/threonine protein kinase
LSNDAPLQRLAQEFDDEANNLQTVTGLQSDYIVKLIKTYKHGDRFNIIFRKEKSDLDHFLRDESWQDQAELLRKGPLESCAIWQHALGITVALGQISCIPDPMASSNPDTREKVLNGFHFDLKPANILVSDLSWLITDFGIARFQQADDGATSRVLSMGGTDSYAPPEMLRVTEKFSRRYDVWSLGCILLEVTAYAVGGRKALLELDAARRSGGRHLGDNRFYSQTFHPGIPYQVKPAITTFMSSLKHREKASGEISGGFLQAVLELITKMLQPLVEHRIEIQKVVPELKRIVASHSQQIPGTPRRLYAEPDPNLNEIDTTPDALRSMKVFHLTYDASGRGSRQLFSARLHTFRRTNGKGTLRVVIADPNQHERPMSLQLNERTGRIIPFGMFETNDRVSFEDSENGSYHDSTFEFLNPADADSFQSHMTHQDISGRYRLSDVEVERRSEFSVSRFFRNRDASDFDEPLGAATAQLWVESEEAFVEAGTWLRSRSQEHTIPIRRLVLFCGQVGNKKNPPKIVSIVVTGAIRYILEHDRPRDLDPRKTRFVPNKPSSDRYISVATIQPLMVDDETRDLPSIPLSITSLRKEEEKVKFDCKKVDLTFSDEAGKW